MASTWRVIFSAGFFALAVTAPSCVAAEDRRDCDRALGVICGCSSRPCDQANPPPIVIAMRRCDGDDVRPDTQENNVHLCIKDSGPNFCRVLDGLATKDGSACKADCGIDFTCTLSVEQECRSYQYASCDIPDAGTGDGASKEAE